MNLTFVKLIKELHWEDAARNITAYTAGLLGFISLGTLNNILALIATLCGIISIVLNVFYKHQFSMAQLRALEMDNELKARELKRKEEISWEDSQNVKL